MIKCNGNNKFIDNTFNKYIWSANIYETEDEIINFFNNKNIINKRLTQVSAIGARLPDCWENKGASKLREVGIDKKSISNSRQFLDGRILTENEIELIGDECPINPKVYLQEPFILYFDDGTSLEILPVYPKGIRLSVNSIPKCIKDGLNRSEFDLNEIFNNQTKGESLRFYLISAKTKESTEKSVGLFTHHGIHKGKDSRKNIEISLFIRCYGIDILIQSENTGMFTVEFRHPFPRTTCGMLRNFYKENKSLYYHVLDEYWDSDDICEFHRHVCAINEKKSTTDTCSQVTKHPTEYFSIFEDGDYPQLVLKALSAKYDKKLNEKFGRQLEGHNGLSWVSYFKKHDIVSACDEIKKNVQLYEITRDISIYPNPAYFYSSTYSFETIISTEIDYTKRFCQRLLDMVNHSDGYDYIVFTGCSYYVEKPLT